ncbi:helix-turn-helix transcriptional regulator, partial [Pseudomonas aeruginosa]|nr:helix-turn-helix transcriptional regulator [Pseudomonas aeruginosa]
RQQHRLPLASLDAYLDRHAAHPLQVADLARLAGLSVARFHSLFLAETGQTPMDYARSRRLHQAHELLLESSLAVGEIAARVGYASQSAFTAALVREFGVTPRQLRRESRDKTG